MNSLARLIVFLSLALAVFGQTPGGAVRPSHPLVWDEVTKTIQAKLGDTETHFEFAVTNSSEQRIEILEIRTSCGCTVAEMPQAPWILEPGAKGSFKATVDIRGRRGRFSKSIMIASTAGPQLLGVSVEIPEPPELNREQRQQLALADRQAVFKGECWSCHVGPIGGKTGAPLYQAACTICHEAEHRASMVPDLMIAKEQRDEAYWRRWITEGKEGTLMPGFGETVGGPLSDRQIDSLVEYLAKTFPSAPSAGQ